MCLCLKRSNPYVLIAVEEAGGEPPLLSFGGEKGQDFAYLPWVFCYGSGVMLRRLRIRNLAVVEELTWELGKGFNALTGETGAGKSILVDAFLLLLGDIVTGKQIGRAHV